MPKIFFRGTIGDTFLNLLKITNLNNINLNDYELIRVSKHQIKEDNLKHLTKIFKIDKKIQFIHNDDFLLNHISKDDIYFENSELSNFQSNKNLFLKSKVKSDPQLLKIGIQIDAGSHQGNYRYIDSIWIKKLINDMHNFDKKRFSFVILGNSKLDIYFDQKISIKNFSGQLSFKDWLKQISELNFLISLEGLPVFFALSNSIPVFMINQYLYKLDASIHLSWNKYLKVFNCNQIPFYKLKKKILYYFKFKNVIKPKVNTNQIMNFIFNFHEK